MSQKLIELQREIEESTIIVGDCITPLYQKWTDPAGRYRLGYSCTQHHHQSAGYN